MRADTSADTSTLRLGSMIPGAETVSTSTPTDAGSMRTTVASGPPTLIHAQMSFPANNATNATTKVTAIETMSAGRISRLNPVGQRNESRSGIPQNHTPRVKRQARW